VDVVAYAAASELTRDAGGATVLTLQPLDFSYACCIFIVKNNCCCEI
jgi:hypothetical protein